MDVRKPSKFPSMPLDLNEEYLREVEKNINSEYKLTSKVEDSKQDSES